MSNIGGTLLKVARTAMPKRLTKTLVEREIAATRQSLDQLESERAAHRSTVASASTRRRDALLSGEAAERIADIERDARIAEIELERLELIELELLIRLDTLRDNARALAWEAIFLRHREVFGKYLSAASALVDAFDAVASVQREAAMTGFETESRHAFQAPPLPHIVTRDIVFGLSREFDRLAEYRPPEKAAAQPAKAVNPIGQSRGGQPLFPTVDDAKRRAVLGGPVQPAAEPVPVPAAVRQPKPRRQPVQDGAPAEGDVAIQVLRAGLEIEGRGQMAIGDRVNVSGETAGRLVRAGAADFLSAEAGAIGTGE